MKTLLSMSVLGFVAACGSAAEVAAPPAPPEPASSPSASTSSAPSETSPPALSPEQLKQQADREQLERDFVQLEQSNAAELARLTPELRAQVKTLVEKSGAGIRSAIGAALKAPHRRPGNAERDPQRHPLATLEFLGVQPNHKVLEYGPGEGWYTELLAPALAKRGKLLVTVTDPNGSRAERATYYGKRTQLFLDSLPEAYSAVERVVVAPDSTALAIPEGSLDVVLLFRGAHGMVNAGTFDSWLLEFNRTLKPKGVLGIEQHRAAAGADPVVTSKQGYLPEAFVIEHAEKAGFKLSSKSEVNANPKDTKDYADGVWTLPPSLRGGETDKAKYVAIGESDRMTLKFTKVPPKPAPKATAATPSASPTSAVTPAVSSPSAPSVPPPAK